MSTPFLVADIGGTNARFGLVEPSTDKTKPNFTASQFMTLKCSNFSDMASMVKECCKQFEIAMPEYGCFAIAGPIENSRVKMTNLGWEFAIEDLRNELGMKKLHAINDFAAQAYATPFLQEQDIKTLYPAKNNSDAPIVVMGPGTGFGMAMLVPENDNWQVIPTEGGHASFAPTNEKELAIKAFLLKEQAHVSVENILSGAGLVNIYRACAHIAGVYAEAFTPADVSNKGLANEDAICREALVVFCNTLGSVAGDKALSTGAKGGVVISGGITPRLLGLLPETDFIERYKNKGPMSNYMNDISIKLITNDAAALVGSAAWLIHHTAELKP